VDVDIQTNQKDRPLTREDVVRRIQEAGSSDKLEMVGLNLKGVDLADFDLSGADLREANLRGADLRAYSETLNMSWTRVA